MRKRFRMLLLLRGMERKMDGEEEGRRRGRGKRGMEEGRKGNHLSIEGREEASRNIELRELVIRNHKTTVKSL